MEFWPHSGQSALGKEGEGHKEVGD
jgi:hypothetical protein